MPCLVYAGRSLGLKKTVSRPEPGATKPDEEYTSMAQAVPPQEVTEAVKRLSIDSQDLEAELANGVAKAALAK